MLHSIDQLLYAEYVYVQVMCTLVKVSVENIYQIVYTFRFIMSQCTRVDGLCIGDTISASSYGSFATEFRDANNPFCSAP